jgi:hypothetical protein
MEARTCPRCGRSFVPRPRGRPRLWCSDECRRLAFEKRRAARAAGEPVEIREEIRARLVERSRPLSPDGAVGRVLSDGEATCKLLRVLAYRMRHDPPPSWVARSSYQNLEPLIHDLWRAFYEARNDASAAVPEPRPTPKNRADALQRATALVLSSPRSTREALSALADRARDGTLASSEHGGTVTAAHDLLNALVAAGILRP